ncbi:hypothetical protein HDU93_001181 [Gonapodya sp. JEL0774]|nr:hypothetical protein HDU93_001181 [Gonapodya sp. JEL0774]
MASASKNTRVLINKAGGPDNLKIETIDAPVPAPGQVLVRHLVAGLGMTDLAVMGGTYFRKFPFPLVPGYDFIGRVEETNPTTPMPTTTDGQQLSVGDTVACMPSHGALQSYSLRAPTDLVKLPSPISSLDPAATVSLILNYTTAYYGLHHSRAEFERRITEAESQGRQVVCLVQAAAGGLGTALLDLLRVEFPKVKVYGTCSASKRAVVEGLGAEAIDYKTTDFVSVIKSKTGDRGADVIFDSNGGQIALRCTYALAPNGRLILFGFTSDKSVAGTIAIARTLVGSYLSFWSAKSAYFMGIVLHREADVAKWNGVVVRLVDMCREGKIAPQVEGYVGLEDAAVGLEYVAKGLVRSKICVAIDDEVVERWVEYARTGEPFGKVDERLCCLNMSPPLASFDAPEPRRRGKCSLPPS